MLTTPKLTKVYLLLFFQKKKFFSVVLF